MIDDASLSAWCEAMAALLDLPVARADRGEILANLRLIARQIAIVAEVPLDDLVEPAPVFRA
ncbi:MAG: DUF4089 domain-containing protein [Pseudomonadota bacterium]